MSGPNIDSNLRQSAREPALKEWRRPALRKLPIDATAGSTAKASGAQNDGSGTKSGDVSNLS
jgi:hypothetical protein